MKHGDIVTIYNKNGKIGLNYCLNDKRKRFSLGLDYNTKNLKIAKVKANELENDIIFNRFDGDVNKYKIKSNISLVSEIQQPLTFTLKDCWELYKRHKKDIIVESEQKTHWVKIDKRLTDLANEGLLEVPDALAAFEFLLEKYAYGSLKNIFKTLSTAVNLAIKLNKYVGKNDYATILELFPKTGKKHQIQSYSKEEIAIIIDAFKSHCNGFYASLIEFRFLVGCRPSEAFALTWDDIVEENDKSWIVFNKAYRNKCLQPRTKTEEIRVFPIFPQLKEFLATIPKQPNSYNLMFPTPMGKYIDNGKFDNNHWHFVVKDQLFAEKKISKYLPFYDQRHTCGTLLLQSGIDIATIAKILGNSPEVLMKHYLAGRNELSDLPNIF